MPFETTIEAFARALDERSAPPPAETLGRRGRPDGKRFSVYRNNVAVGLIGVVEARYPIVRRLVGDDFFRAMARAYVGQNKPRLALLIAYGEDFADFVAGFEPAREIAYLADVARLENAWVEAYHSVEAAPVGLDALAALAPEALPGARLTLHPAVRLLRLAHPAASIWAGHQGEGEPRPPEKWAPEDVLIARPEAEVSVRVLPRGGYDFAVALAGGASFAEAASSAGDDFDPGPHLVGLIQAGAVAEILAGDAP